MKLREFLRTRRQRTARKRYESEKALRQKQNDGAMDGAADDLAKKLGSIGGSGMG